jgi:hypothetical protein
MENRESWQHSYAGESGRVSRQHLARSRHSLSEGLYILQASSCRKKVLYAGLPLRAIVSVTLTQ